MVDGLDIVSLMSCLVMFVTFFSPEFWTNGNPKIQSLHIERSIVTHTYNVLETTP